MTKEEILEAELTYTAHKAALNAMDAYSKQIAIGFAEWIDGNNYQCVLMTDEGVKYWQHWPENKSLTTDQLFEKYLQTLQPISHEPN